MQCPIRYLCTAKSPFSPTKFDLICPNWWQWLSPWVDYSSNLSIAWVYSRWLEYKWMLKINRTGWNFCNLPNPSRPITPNIDNQTIGVANHLRTAMMIKQQNIDASRPYKMWCHDAMTSSTIICPIWQKKWNGFLVSKQFSCILSCFVLVCANYSLNWIQFKLKIHGQLVNGLNKINWCALFVRVTILRQSNFSLWITIIQPNYTYPINGRQNF